jgi:hypothetical protein
MKEYNLGPDELYLGDDADEGIPDDNVEWVVYFYEYGCYDGSGVAVWKVGDKFGMQCLGHCSCYGPMNDARKATMSLEELLEELKPISETDYNYECAKKVYDKVISLMGDNQ